MKYETVDLCPCPFPLQSFREKCISHDSHTYLRSFLVFLSSLQTFECRNHIRVIQSMENGNRLYICGTNAHNPKDYVIYVSLKGRDKYFSSPSELFLVIFSFPLHSGFVHILLFVYGRAHRRASSIKSNGMMSNGIRATSEHSSGRREKKCFWPTANAYLRIASETRIVWTNIPAERWGDVQRTV